jgi:hypothetical protein
LSGNAEQALAMALDQHRTRVARFLAGQGSLRLQVAEKRTMALIEGRFGEASLLDRFDACLATTGSELRVLMRRLEEHRRTAVNGDGEPD